MSSYWCQRTTVTTEASTFVGKLRAYYLRHGYDYKEATRHAEADRDWWLERLGLTDDEGLSHGTDDGGNSGSAVPE